MWWADTPAAALGKICTVAFLLLDVPGLNQGMGAGRDSNPAHEPLSHFATAKNYFLWPKHFTSSKRLTSVGDSRGSFFQPVENGRVHHKCGPEKVHSELTPYTFKELKLPYLTNFFFRRRKNYILDKHSHMGLNGQKPFHATAPLKIVCYENEGSSGR